MPPKPKLHKTSGKTTIPQAWAENIPSTSTSILDPEVEQKFELELCWCIQQLQRSLNSGKLDQKQAQESSKVLNTLMSNTAPIIKKRQVMRITFGDYRAKMAAEEKKVSKGLTNLKIVPSSSKTKSVFVKKSALMTTSSGNSFKFNFNVEEKDVNNISNGMSQVNVSDNQNKNNDLASAGPHKFSFQPSGNDFRFNFSEESS